ncbi:hypothetical protein [Sedimentibacter sp.]|uniref:hypothetical protein n=1 Tax=Sedimentibacter sp. TaxID=1960295 RepID=UPI0028B11FF7|nr:hypothetical protein [Sedimentibacter sp.]
MCVKRCIYCNTDIDLSESDVIPDALTNARVTNKCVCRIKHNNNFSDLFESKVINALALITNELDIKSSKGSDYAAYPAMVKIAGTEYETTMRTETDLFNGRVIKSVDKKHLLTSFDKAISMAKDESKVEAIDVNNIEVEKKVTIGLDIYFDQAMYRLVAKIAYEWYCAKNKVSGYHGDFKNIVTFITEGHGENPVGIVWNKDVYNLMSNQLNMGSHCLLAFQDHEDKINIIVNLFGIVIYRVVVCDHTPEFCANNLLYQELCTDSSRKEIIQTSPEALEREYVEYLSSTEHFTPVPLPNGMKCMIPNGIPSIDILQQMFICNVVNFFKKVHDEIKEPNKEIVGILRNNIEEIMQSSLFHKKSIKRFVKECFKDRTEPIKINPNTTNKKVVFLLYILFVIGNGEIDEINDQRLQQIIKNAFHIDGNNEIIITDELVAQLKEAMLKQENYSNIIEKGAAVIQHWE